MDNKVEIRVANIDDLPNIYELVKALAKFENEPLSVRSTLLDYQDAFNSNLIEIKVAESQHEIIGMALYYDTFSTWRGKMLYLEDFIIKATHRSKGIGKMLFDAVVDEALVRKCKMMKWQVLDWNTRAMEFYEQYNPKKDGEWIDFKIYFD